MSEPFRDPNHAALERVSTLEAENAELRAKLTARLQPPVEERTLPRWLMLLFIAMPLLLIFVGLFVALALRTPAP